MPSLGDSAFIFVLALLLFGPKKLPELARQLGKLMGEFRRASNEFRMQMEDELRISEQAERQKEIAAIEAAAPVTPALDPAPANTIGATPSPAGRSLEEPADLPVTAEAALPPIEDPLDSHPHMISRYPVENAASEPQVVQDPAPLEPAPSETPPVASAAPPPEPLPIATSGSLRMRPPKTGMPLAQSMGTPPGPASPLGRNESGAPLSPLFNAIPHDPATAHEPSSQSAVSTSEPVAAGTQDSGSHGTLAPTEASHHA